MKTTIQHERIKRLEKERQAHEHELRRLDSLIARELPENLREGLRNIAEAYESIDGTNYCDPGKVCYKMLGRPYPGESFYDEVLLPLSELGLVALWWTNDTGQNTVIEFTKRGREIARSLAWLVE